MAVTNIPNITNWSVTPQNGQVGYFSLMNTWLSESTAVIASLKTAITAQNTANGEINALAIQVAGNAIDAQNARNEALTAVATLQGGAIDNTTIAPNKAFSNQYTNSNFVKLTGNQTIAGTKTFSSSIVGNITGNAGTATKLETARTINGVAFDGSANITVSDSTAVKLTGNETIAGIKTFSSSPIVPTPTANTQAANKAYVDTKQANLGFQPVQQGAGIGQLGNTVKIGWSSGLRTKITIDETDMGNIVMDDHLAVANSPLVKTALNASGTAPIYACRAWVNFNGTGTVAIRASGNVSSITDNGVGDYTVNFTTAMPDANYSIGCMGTSATATTTSAWFALKGTYAGGATNKTVNGFQVITAGNSNTVDVANAEFSIFR